MTTVLTTFTTTTTTDPAAAAGALFGSLLTLVVTVALVGLIYMGLFRKAGRPAWAAFVPVYNSYVILKIVGRPGWWLVLLFIPMVNVVISILMMIDLAKSFGRGTGFAIGLIFLPPIFALILSYGSDRYVGPAALGPQGTGLQGAGTGYAGMYGQQR